jgi:hypothetical protein
MIPVGAELAASLATGGDTAPLAALLHGIAQRLDHGRGFVLLRGLDLDQLQESGVEAALLTIGGLLGTTVPQDAGGTLVGRLSTSDASTDAPRFHAEAADIVALLCLQQPAEGGQVTLVAAAALHNALLKADRTALAELHGMLPHRPPVGDAPLPQAIFATEGGVFAGRYDRAALDAQALTAPQDRALSVLDATAAAEGQALTLGLHAGDLLLYNPGLVWKQVTTGPDDAAREMPRMLLSLWLAKPGSGRSRKG